MTVVKNSAGGYGIIIFLSPYLHDAQHVSWVRADVDNSHSRVGHRGILYWISDEICIDSVHY